MSQKDIESAAPELWTTDHRTHRGMVVEVVGRDHMDATVKVVKRGDSYRKYGDTFTIPIFMLDEKKNVWKRFNAGN